MAKPLNWLILTAFLLSTLFAHAQNDSVKYSPDHLYQPAQLHADLAFLKSVLEEAHPSLYRYTPKDTLDARFATADARLNQPMTELDFWKIVTRYVAAVRSGHTVITPSAAYTEWYNKHPLPRLPLTVYIVNDRLFAARVIAKQTNGVFPGAEIVSIDGHSAAEILAAERPLDSPEGYSMQAVNNHLERGSFAGLYSWLYTAKPEYDVAFIDSSGATRHAELKATVNGYGYSADKFKGMLEQEKDDLLDKSIIVNYFNDIPSTVYLKIKSFGYRQDYAAFDAGFFDRIRKEHIKNLIIDLRGNGGGYLNIGADLLYYLVDGYYVPSHTVTAPTNTYSFNQYIVYPGSDTLRTNSLVKTGKHEYTLINDYRVRNAPSSVTYNKKVFVLIDGGTFSAASVFVADLKSQRDVTIIGEESGGGEAGTDGRGFSIVRLPNTGLLLRLPQFWMSTTTHNKNTGHGIMPDIPIVPNIASRVSKKDVVLTTVLQLIVSQPN